MVVVRLTAHWPWSILRAQVINTCGENTRYLFYSPNNDNHVIFAYWAKIYVWKNPQVLQIVRSMDRFEIKTNVKVFLFGSSGTCVYGKYALSILFVNTVSCHLQRIVLKQRLVLRNARAYKFHGWNWERIVTHISNFSSNIYLGNTNRRLKVNRSEIIL